MLFLGGFRNTLLTIAPFYNPWEQNGTLAKMMQMLSPETHPLPFMQNVLGIGNSPECDFTQEHSKNSHIPTIAIKTASQSVAE